MCKKYLILAVVLGFACNNIFSMNDDKEKIKNIIMLGGKKYLSEGKINWNKEEEKKLQKTPLLNNKKLSEGKINWNEKEEKKLQMAPLLKIKELEKTIKNYENFVSDLRLDITNKGYLNGDCKDYLSIKQLLDKYNLTSQKDDKN